MKPDNIENLEKFINGCDEQLSTIVTVCEELQKFFNVEPIASVPLPLVAASLKVYCKTLEEAFPQVRLESGIYSELIKTQTEVNEETIKPEGGNNVR